MTTKIVSQVEKSALVVGMSWHPLVSDLKHRPSEIRSILSESEATKIAMASSHGSTTVGLYTPEDDDSSSGEGSKKPSKLYSLALAFAALVGEDGNAVFAYQIPGTPLAALILIESGRPVVDDVKLCDDVQTQVANYSNGSSTGFAYTQYTNDLGSFPEGVHIDDAKLWEFATKETALQNKPVNVKALLILLVTVAVVVGGGFGYSVYDKAEKRKQLLINSQKNNPVTKYEAEMSQKIGALGLDSHAVINLLNFMGTQPIRDSGWALKNISCAPSAGQCVSLWGRQGGITTDLVASRARVGETVLGDGSLNETQFSIKVDMKPTGIASRQDLPDASSATASDTPIYQVLANAGVDFKAQADSYKVWPTVAGINANEIPLASAIQAHPMEFTSSMAMAVDVLSSLPKNIWWTDIRIDIPDSAKDALGSLTVSVKGNSYVR